MRPIGLLAAVALTILPGPAAHAQAPQDPRTDRAIEYARPDGQPLLLDAYLPARAEPTAAAILVHGGSWSEGTRADERPTAEALASAGIAAFAIDYRLAPAHPFPAAVEDARAAVRWVRAHAGDYGVDPARIAIVGTSAGGHVAAMVGMLGHGSRDTGSRVRAVVSLSGPMNLRTLASDAPPAQRPAVERALRDFAGAGALAEASPIDHVDPSDAAMLLVNGTDEIVGLAQAEEMARRLSANGVPQALVTVEGALHAREYLGVTLPGGDTTVASEVVAFLDRWLPVDWGIIGPPYERISPRARVAGLLLFTLAIVAAALFPAIRERRRLHRALGRHRPDAAAIARIDALGIAGHPRAEIVSALEAEGYRPPRDRVPA